MNGYMFKSSLGSLFFYFDFASIQHILQYICINTTLAAKPDKILDAPQSAVKNNYAAPQLPRDHPEEAQLQQYHNDQCCLSFCQGVYDHVVSTHCDAMCTLLLCADPLSLFTFLQKRRGLEEPSLWSRWKWSTHPPGDS